MPRFRSFEGAVRWDIEREERRHRARLRTTAAVFSLVAFVFITALTTVSLQKLHQAEEQEEGTRGDPLRMPVSTAGLRRKPKPDAASSSSSSSVSSRTAAILKVILQSAEGKEEKGEGRGRRGRVGEVPPRVTPTPPHVTVRVRVHVVVEHAARIEMLLLRDPASGEWGPCVGQTATSRGTQLCAGHSCAEVTAVRRAAAAALLDQAGLGQPPDIEFMQALPPLVEFRGDGGVKDRGEAGGMGGDGDGAGVGIIDDGTGAGSRVTPSSGVAAAAEVAYVALVRAEHLRAGAGGLRGGGGGRGGGRGGGSRESRGVALETALRGASSGELISGGGGGFGGGGGGGGDGGNRAAALAASLPGTLARGLRSDVAVLRRFLEPWVVTTGKDPKAACKDPRVAAAHAADAGAGAGAGALDQLRR